MNSVCAALAGCTTTFCLWQKYSATHFPPEDKFQKWGCPRVALVEPPFLQYSYCQLYLNNAFSILTLMMFNADSICIHPRIRIQALMMENRNNLDRILEILRISIYWNQVLWSSVRSNMIPGHSWHLRKAPYMSWFIFKIIDFWCFSGVWSSSSSVLSNRIQLHNSRHWWSWFHTQTPTVPFQPLNIVMHVDYHRRLPEPR